MARRTNDPIQQFRGTTAKHATYIGPAGELTVDTDKNTVVVHDGATAGGFPLAKESTTITASNGLTVTSGGTLAANTNIAGVDATTSAKGVVQLESALSGTANLVPDSAAVKTYVDNAVETYTAAAPLSIDANNEISISAATTAAAGSMSAADKTKLDSLSAMTAAAPLSIDSNNEISISAATTTDAGSMSAADKTKLDGITTMTGATSVAAGASGLVPAPAAGDDDAFLKGDGTWGTPAGKTYTATAPVVIDANDDISVADATASAKGVVQIGDNVDVASGVISVKPWADYAADSSSVTVSDLQENAIVVTDEPVGGSAEAVLATIEQTLSGDASKVPSSAAFKAVVEEWHSGTDWYRVWSDGWCEQGGKTALAATTNIALYKAYTDTNYAIFLGAQKTGVGNNWVPYSLNIQTTGFTIKCENNTIGNFWKAEGYIS